MRYLIEENENGKYMIRYTTEGFLSEGSDIEEDVTVDILKVWQPTYLESVKTEDIEDEFGVSLDELKGIIGKCLSKAQSPKDVWIRANILNIM